MIEVLMWAAGYLAVAGGLAMFLFQQDGVEEFSLEYVVGGLLWPILLPLVIGMAIMAIVGGVFKQVFRK